MEPLFVRWMDRLYLASIWIAGSAITLMALIIPWGVFSRYVMGTGSQWPEPIAILLMMQFTFIGAACAYRAGGHIAVNMLTEVLPRPVQAALVWVVDALMLLICGFVTWYGTNLCRETWGQGVSELPWLPVGATYAALPIGAAITFLFVLEKCLYGAQSGRAIVRYEEGLDHEPAAQES